MAVGSSRNNTQNTASESKSDVRQYIMIVDDDQALGEMLSIVLQSQGFRTQICTDGIQALQALQVVQPDIILLDVMLPGMSGIAVAQRIRQNISTNVPIIMLTAKSDTQDIVTGLQAGADDYVAKPFQVAELVARIQARLRSIPQNTNDTQNAVPTSTDVDSMPAVLTAGDITVDRNAHIVTRHGVDLYLTPVEFDLLTTLIMFRGEVLTRGELLERVWGYPSNGDARLVNVHIQRLRHKLELDPEHPQYIVTVRGLGYRFEIASE